MRNLRDGSDRRIYRTAEDLRSKVHSRAIQPPPHGLPSNRSSRGHSNLDPDHRSGPCALRSAFEARLAAAGPASAKEEKSNQAGGAVKMDFFTTSFILLGFLVVCYIAYKKIWDFVVILHDIITDYLRERERKAEAARSPPNRKIRPLQMRGMQKDVSQERNGDTSYVIRGIRKKAPSLYSLPPQKKSVKR